MSIKQKPHQNHFSLEFLLGCVFGNVTLGVGGGGRGRGTLTYELYGYVPLQRIWFSGSLISDRV